MPAEALPSTGDLARHSLARVVLALWRRSFTGTLGLTHGATQRRFQWRDGAVVGTASTRREDGLVEQLIASGRITAADQARLVAYREQREVHGAAALLALEILEPTEIVRAVREQISRQLVDAFGWTEGPFALDETATPGPDSAAFRVDPIRILQDGIAAWWRPDRILADLGPWLGRYAEPSEQFDALTARLRPGPDLDALRQAIAPERPLGEAVGRSDGPARLALVWILAETGAVRFHESAPSKEREGEAAADPASGLEIEIEIEVAASSAASEEAGGDTMPARLELPSPEAEALRKEMLDLHERLDQLDHYEVLGLASDAPSAAVKKAYFAAAKRFHPDAVSRLGLSALHREANELFARIAQAYQTLSVPSRRSAYDAREDDSGTPSADANRVAQAEAMFRKGEILIKVGNFAGALDFLRPCVELWPEEADYQAALGWALYKRKPSDPEAARAHLEKADTLRGDDPLTLFRLGMVLRRLGETEAGQARLDRSKALERKGSR